MARIPTYDSPTVSPSALPNVQQQAPAGLERGFGIQGAQQKELGGAMLKAGDSALSIATDMQNEANNVRVQDALNQAREHALTLTYDPKIGYMAQKGQSALQRESGVPLPTEYNQKFQEAVGSISAGLGNDAQKKAFALHSASIGESLQSGAASHMLSEFNTYHASVADGAIKLGTNAAVLGWNNPDTVNQNIDQVKAATYEKGRLAGLSANDIQAASDATVSKIHADVVNAALENNNPAYAMSYFNQTKGSFTADDILKVQGKLNTQVDKHVALSAVQDTTREHLAQFNPSDMDRLTNVVGGMESATGHYNPDGSVVTSSKGAKGAMQIMTATGQDPGFGVTPMKDDSPEENKRFGKEYLAAMVKQYSSVDKALAAYNAGPGAVNTAVDKAKADGQPMNWLANLPKETQGYVSKGLTQFYSGGGSAQPPTEQQFVQAAVAKLGDNPRPEAYEATQTAAEKQYKLMIASRKQMADQALGTAQQQLLQNGGDFNGLSPDVMIKLAQTDPDNIAKAREFAQKAFNNNTNLASYNKAVSHPEELAAMTDTEFAQTFRTQLSDNDFKAVAKIRANELNSATDTSASAINIKALNPIVNSRLAAIGIDPNPKKGDTEAEARIGGIRSFINSQIYAQQHQVGKKFTPEELQNAADNIFAMQSVSQHWYGDNTMPTVQMQVGDLPSGAHEAITKQLTALGKPTTDTDVLNYYRKWRAARGK